MYAFAIGEAIGRVRSWRARIFTGDRSRSGNFRGWQWNDGTRIGKSVARKGPDSRSIAVQDPCSVVADAMRTHPQGQTPRTSLRQHTSFEESYSRTPLPRGRMKCIRAAERTVDGDQVRL